ncbi:glycine betaine ABC transporter substrate-binding protein [Oceanisphaera avium]|nr:glycine betaine ABC transporter substrate-binding protein [Oceanisphaera avium]
MPNSLFIKSAALTLALLLLSGCGKDANNSLLLLSGSEPAELARSHLAAATLEQHDFSVTIEEARLGQIWQRLWAGKGDASVTVWLPEASAPFVERFFDRLDDLGAIDQGLAQESRLNLNHDKPHVLVRRSLAQEAPAALAVLSNLHWQAEDIEQLIEYWQDTQDWSVAAQTWLAEQAANAPVNG